MDTPEGRAIKFSRTLRSVTETHIVDSVLITTPEARKLDSFAASLQEIYSHPATLRRKDSEQEIASPTMLLEAIYVAGRKGLSIQRYKGLGEMNPDQLWETTMNPETRSIMHVTLDDDVEAENAVTTLMGEAVEPRRKFIEENALQVGTLDISLRFNTIGLV